jgi:hypothetical protein
MTSLAGIELQRTVLRELIEQARASDARSTTGAAGDAGKAFGLPETVRAVLADERAEKFIPRLVAVNAVRLRLDLNALAHACQRIERQWWEEALLHYFVSARASTAMIQAFFRHVSRPRVERLRRELKVAPPAKPAALTREQLAKVFDIWSELQGTELDERERYVELHERCGARYTLATLFAAVKPDEDGCGSGRVARYAGRRRARDDGRQTGRGIAEVPACSGELRRIADECC